MREITCYECDGNGWIITYAWSGLPEQERCEICNGTKTVHVEEEFYNMLLIKESMEDEPDMISYTAKDIVKVLREAKEIIKLNTFESYALTSFHDPEGEMSFVQAPYDLITFQAILAFIQFEGEDYDESYCYDGNELVEILVKHYGCIMGAFDFSEAMIIDTYYNREAWCGSGLECVTILGRKGMDKDLKGYADAYRNGASGQ